jgi:hypothetical protein
LTTTLRFNSTISTIRTKTLHNFRTFTAAAEENVFENDENVDDENQKSEVSNKTKGTE